MPTVDEYLDVVDSPHALQIEDPEDEALLKLLILVAFSDGVVQEDELAFLHRLLPGQDPADLRRYAASAVQGDPLADIASVLDTVELHWKGLRFAARMAWKDGDLDEAERELLERLAATLRMPRGAVDQVLLEMAGTPTEVDAERLVSTLKSMGWDAVQLASGELSSRDLVAVVPEGAHLVARIGLDAVEVMGLYREGLAGRFLEGAAFLRWSDIVTYTRVPVFGASVQLHTEDGGTWTLVDTRLRGLAGLLDRLYGVPRPAPPGEPPVIHPVRLIKL